MPHILPIASAFVNKVLDVAPVSVGVFVVAFIVFVLAVRVFRTKSNFRLLVGATAQ